MGVPAKGYFTESGWEGQLSCLQLVQSISHLLRGALMPSPPSPLSNLPKICTPFFALPTPQSSPRAPVQPPLRHLHFTPIPPDSGVSVFNPSRNLYMSHLGYLRYIRHPVKKKFLCNRSVPHTKIYFNGAIELYPLQRILMPGNFTL